MIRFLTARTRIGLVVAAMAVAVPMITFPQTNQPTTESEPAVAKAAVANASPTSDENSTDTDTSLKTVPLAKSSISAAVENELRRELLDDRAAYIDRWLSVIAIVLIFFSIVAVVLGYIGFKRFREIETDARNSTVVAAEHAQDAKRVVKEIEKTRDKADEIVRGMTAETAAGNPEEAKQAVLSVRENPRASLVDEAIANAISLQQQGKRDNAIEKWRAIAHIAEGSDNDLAVRAWLSIAYLAFVGDSNLAAVLAYDEAIRLKPDYAVAYNSRGSSKVMLKRYDDAIADYDEAIRLEPDYAAAYNSRGNLKVVLKRYDDAIADYNEVIRLEPAAALKYTSRGILKALLGRYDDAIADYDEAIRLKPDYAAAYNSRGAAKTSLGLKDEARKDFETELELARNANNLKEVKRAEQSLRDLDDGA